MGVEQSDFINLYIQNLITEVTELTKTKILLTTQSGFKDDEIEDLKKQVVDLEELSEKEKAEIRETWKTALKEKDTEGEDSQQQIVDLRRQLDAKNNQLIAVTARSEELAASEKAKEEIIGSLNNNIKAKEDENNKLKDVIQSFEKNNKPVQEKKVEPQKGKNKKAVNTAVLLE